ncbi:hypothetical protein TRAPUB_4570 [Trametes pubescens]|uniref:Uncharacterized protein n=1 Tax=Trametes pubescens TaxID=154538 RepID=A0A1M2VB41_TRAPU|nr:hypothetical protein TRAPUB_4570 [Trametes pubescens]
MSLLAHPDRAAVYGAPAVPDALSWRVRLTRSWRNVFHHVSKHVGVGIICSVAYFDP